MRRIARSGSLLLLVALAALWVLGSTPTGSAAPRAPRQGQPILGAAVTILADGTAPWEDRPFAVSGLGTLPGVRGKADPGDDPGPDDGVVRSWDAVVYRASFSVRDAPAEDVVAEVTLTGLAIWEPGQLAALRLAGCPGGATLLDNGQRLRCNVGRVAAPPAVTVALDLSARVSGAALQGDLIQAAMTVRSPGAIPDPDVVNCPVPQAEGCDATAKPVTVSAAPAAELRKVLAGVNNTVVGGVAGRQVSWQLEAILGADGDVRGTSLPVGEPWTLPDWWRISAESRTLNLPVQLLGCSDLDGQGGWTCAQPGGPGSAVSITLAQLNLAARLPNGVGSSQPVVVAQARVELWVPEADVQAARGDVTFSNCFATQPGFPNRALWQPVDARGQPNLGGMPEPLANNCSFVVLPVPKVVPPPRPPVRPPPPRRPGPPRVVPTPTQVPSMSADKTYTPYTKGAAVTDGSEFSSQVRVHLAGLGVMPGVIACDKWDNSTHTLREGGIAGARVLWQVGDAAPEPMPDPSRVVVEFAAGRWGRLRPEQLNVGRTWLTQATTSCADTAPATGSGWVTAGHVDFANQGRQKIDANAVNMVRARFLDPLPAGVTVWLEVPLKAERNPPGTWLMNYGGAGWGQGGRVVWFVPECYGATGSRTRRECPVPAAGTTGQPGPFGDMLVHVGVPLWLTKRTDPVDPGGSPVVNAGETVSFVLNAATFPRPGDPPGPAFPPGAVAAAVSLSDTLPVGLYYEVGSARIASEDLNGSGTLDPGEDRNGNGRLDADVPFEPLVSAGDVDGETVLRWSLGDLPYQRNVPAIRYTVRTSRLLRGGSSLANRAVVWAQLDRVPDCRTGQADRSSGSCAWAQVIVANIAAAQVEKVPRAALVLPGEALVYRLALANLTNRPVEWFDAVDILPRAGEPRAPETQLTGGVAEVSANVLAGGPPLEVWASATDPETLDTGAGSPRDGLVDPVAAWGGPGAGLGGPDWPCRLTDVGGARCTAIRNRADVTALRLWGPDPQPRRSGGAMDSFLAANSAPRWLDVTLRAPGTVPGDLAHNAWGGRFESLPLPVFDDALIRVRAPDTATPTITPPASQTPLPSATPTELPPTATPTPLPTYTPTRTPTATSTPTPTVAIRRSIYIPVILNVECADLPADVVLVMDVSSSMTRPAGDGGTKQQAVMRAARTFLDRFVPEGNRRRVAVVGFNHSAWVIQPLTGDRGRLDAALARLPSLMAEGTRLDLGLTVGASALPDAGSGRWRAMIFLTDGLPNRVPTPVAGGTQEDTVLTAAAAVRAAGVTIYSVGYGREDAPDLADRILPSLLKAIAGATGGYFETDDATALAVVFRRLATDLGCLGGSGWP